MSVSREFNGPPGGEYIPLFPPLCKACGYHHSEGYPHVKLSPRDSMKLALDLIDAERREQLAQAVKRQRITATRGHMFGLGRYWIAFGSTRSHIAVEGKHFAVAALQATARGRQVSNTERHGSHRITWEENTSRVQEAELDCSVSVGRAVALGLGLAALVVLWAAFAL